MKTGRGAAYKANWALIEVDYMLGVKSLRQMADEFCNGGYGNALGETITAVAISNHFKELKYRRKKTKGTRFTKQNHIDSALDSVVANEAVTALTRTTNQQLLSNQGHTLTPDVIALVVSAATTARTVLAHRNDIAKAREINAALFNKLDLLMREKDTNAVALQTRATVCKILTESMRTLIHLERQALNIPDVAPEAAPTEDKKTLNHDVARRVAFLLMSAAKGQGGTQ